VSDSSKEVDNVAAATTTLPRGIAAFLLDSALGTAPGLEAVQAVQAGTRLGAVLLRVDCLLPIARRSQGQDMGTARRTMVPPPLSRLMAALHG
jgi:hypothetical protein